MLKQVFAVTAVLFLLSGCGTDRNASDGNARGVREVKQSVDRPDRNPSNREIAKRLVTLANDVPGVRGATAIVAGDYAVVGIDVDKDLDRSRVGTIKYSVAQALKNDPYGANAAVTSDPDIVQRLKNMGNKIRRGQPLSGVANELAAIVERIVPEVPQQPLQPSDNLQNDGNRRINNPVRPQPSKKQAPTDTGEQRRLDQARKTETQP